MKTSTFHELNSVLLGLNQAVQPEVLNKEEITERIAFLQANRKRIAGSGYYGNMNHSFKLKGNKDYNSKVKEEYDDFIKSKWEWQEANDGAYFRNNVWWWRPLWNFVCSICDDILTEKDMEKGGWNDGHKISKTKSKKIASRIRSHIKDGQVKEYESYYTKKVAQLDDKDWNKHYPFSIDNVKQFERFCEHSGGFEIW